MDGIAAAQVEQQVTGGSGVSNGAFGNKRYAVAVALRFFAEVSRYHDGAAVFVVLANATMKAM